MSCIKVTLTREGGITSSLERIGDFTTTLTRVDGITSGLVREGGISTTLTRKGGMSCKMWQVCSSGIRRPYLEISPTVVWVLAGYTYNDVYSNTTWNID